MAERDSPVQKQKQQRGRRLFRRRKPKVSTPNRRPSAPAAAMSKQPLSPHDLELVRKVGTGSFGVVYCARVKGGGGALFAVKVLKKLQVISEEASDAVLRERSLARSVEHAFVVTLRCSFQSLDSLYFCTDFYAGGSLAARLRAHGKFDVDSVDFYAAELCSGLNYLHSRRVVHRDVKPANILLHHSGHIALSDFGLSSIMLSTSSSSSKRHFSSANDESFLVSSGFAGTVPYMAPELLLRSSKYLFTSSIDWWAFGCTVFELLTCRTPFVENTSRQLFSNILHADPPPVDDDCCQKKHLSTLISRTLDKNPLTRAQANEVVQLFSHVDFDKLEMKLIPPPNGIPALPNFLTQVDGILRLSSDDDDDAASFGEKKSAVVVSPPPPCPLSSRENKENEAAAADSVIRPFKNFAWTGPADLASSPRTYSSASKSSFSSSSSSFA